MQGPPRRIAIISAHDKEEAQLFEPEIREWLDNRGCTVLSEADLHGDHGADALVALGGDGLMMHVAHQFPGIPIIGINFGTVGFLAMVERSQWQQVMEDVVSGAFEYQDGPTLTATIFRDGRTIDAGWAINDVVIHSGFRMIDVELYIDRQYVNTYPSDGMIVASPQGSTAYCMAAGGPILTAGVKGFALTPISPHSPIRATLVVPEESLIEMVAANDREAHLILDGDVVEKLRHGDVVLVSRGEQPFRMIVVNEMSFYRAFRRKFNYLIRPGAQPSLGDDRR